MPGQGGTGHINEQWPEYWAALFADHGYEVIDAFRSAVWQEPSLAPCIRQNVLLFAGPEAIDANPRLAAARDATDRRRLAIVHPGVLADATDPERVSLRRTLRSLGPVTAAALRRRMPSAEAPEQGTQGL